MAPIMHVPNLLQQRFVDALKGLTDDPVRFASMIRPTADPRHGDYQANCAMPLAKQPGTQQNPREVASSLIAKLDVSGICETPEIAGPGFINLKLKDSFLADALRGMLGDARCGVPQVGASQSIVIDFSSPNVAKPMHVGHIRSTVIGDSLARTLRFLGHPVITDNHLGDWGTQFGIIIYGYKHFGDPDTVKQDPVNELTKLYRLTNQLIEYRKALGSIDRLSAEENEASEMLQDERERVVTCLGKLSGQDRKLVHLRYRENTSVQQVAESLGRSADSVYKSLQRVRRVLLGCVRRLEQAEER